MYLKSRTVWKNCKTGKLVWLQSVISNHDLVMVKCMKSMKRYPIKMKNFMEKYKRAGVFDTLHSKNAKNTYTYGDVLRISNKMKNNT